LAEAEVCPGRLVLIRLNFWHGAVPLEESVMRLTIALTSSPVRSLNDKSPAEPGF